MKIKLLSFFLICAFLQANAQCGAPPPPGLNLSYGLDTDNDGFASFDLQYFIDHDHRPNMEGIFNASSSGYTFMPRNSNMELIPLLYTNTVLNENVSLDFEHNGSGPVFEAQPPCYWPIEIYMHAGIRLVPVPFNGDFDGDGVLNEDEDANRNGNLMDDDDDHDSLINLKDTDIVLATHTTDTITFTIYPNPVTNGIMAFESNVSISAVSIYDLSGKQLLEASNPSNQVNVEQLASGIYFLKFQSDNASTYRKIIIRN